MTAINGIEVPTVDIGRVHFEPEFIDLGNGYFGLAASSEILASTPAQIAHPLGPPTVSGTTISVDMMLRQPRRITRMIMDMTLQRFVADRIFSSGGGVVGGAVV